VGWPYQSETEPVVPLKIVNGATFLLFCQVATHNNVAPPTIMETGRPRNTVPVTVCLRAAPDRGDGPSKITF
jgi:hypothetical protein